MIKVTLVRKQVSNTGTKGLLTCTAPSLYLYTLENPWKNNARSVSCIPSGRYKCEIVQSPKFGTVYEVKDVEARSHILFHAGNYPRDTSGCILLGESGDFLSPYMFIGNSQKALKEFMNKLAGESFELEIIYDEEITDPTVTNSSSG